MPPLLIADIPWLLYRAFFSLPKSIVGADGQPVNALLGTVNALLGMLEARPSRAVVACLGAEEAAYRVRLYPPYHAQRDAMPPELRWQWEQAPGLLASLGWTVATDDRLEADDVMFSYALAETEGRGAERGGALLLTGDRDLFAAVGERVAVVLPGKDGGAPTEIGPLQVRERYGIDPALVPDFIALRGDPGRRGSERRRPPCSSADTELSRICWRPPGRPRSPACGETRRRCDRARQPRCARTTSCCAGSRR
jgi:5'-3' exonuclease